MSVVMKNRQKQNKVLPLPKPPEEPERIVIQVGKDRFAIHWETRIEELPPVPPVTAWKRRGKHVTMKIVK
jgi:hypothetical protein